MEKGKIKTTPEQTKINLCRGVSEIMHADFYANQDYAMKREENL